MASNDETLALARGLAQLATDFRLDAISVSPSGEVKIVKGYHEPRPGLPGKTTADPSEDDEDELALHSAEA